MEKHVTSGSRMEVSFFDRNVSHDPIREIDDVTSVNIVDEFPNSFDAVRTIETFPTDKSNKIPGTKRICISFTTSKDDMPYSAMYENPYPFLNGDICKAKDDEYVKLCSTPEEIKQFIIAMVTRHQRSHNTETRCR